MELRQIEFFLQLYKDKNITVASQNLYISQQGMSKSIANLEKEVGFPLFKRSVSGMEPTEEAEELYMNFRMVMESYSGLQKKIKELEIRGRGVLNIVWPEFFAMACEKEEYATFSGQNPGIDIYVLEEKEETVLHFLREGIADVGFMTAPIPKDLKAHILVGREPLCAFVNRNHPLANKEEIQLEDLSQYTLLFSKGNTITKKNILKKAKREAGLELILDEIPYALMLHTVYTKEFIGVAQASVFRYMDFPELICKPIKYNGEDFYTLDVYLVTTKQENYKAETEKYIAYQKKTHEGEFDLPKNDTQTKIK